MKVRLNFVSNSSSSSYIIACKGEENADKVVEAYGKLFDLWMELNPDDIGHGLYQENYHRVTVDEIIEHFKECGMNKDNLKYNKKSFQDEAKNGYVFLLGTAASDDGTPQYQIIEMFNEYLIYCLKGKYNWEKNEYKHDIELVFQTRWS